MIGSLWEGDSIEGGAKVFLSMKNMSFWREIELRGRLMNLRRVQSGGPKNVRGSKDLSPET